MIVSHSETSCCSFGCSAAVSAIGPLLAFLLLLQEPCPVGRHNSCMLQAHLGDSESQKPSHGGKVSHLVSMIISHGNRLTGTRTSHDWILPHVPLTLRWWTPQLMIVMPTGSLASALLVGVKHWRFGPTGANGTCRTSGGPRIATPVHDA